MNNETILKITNILIDSIVNFKDSNNHIYVKNIPNVNHFAIDIDNKVDQIYGLCYFAHIILESLDFKSYDTNEYLKNIKNYIPNSIISMYWFKPGDFNIRLQFLYHIKSTLESGNITLFTYNINT